MHSLHASSLLSRFHIRSASSSREIKPDDTVVLESYLALRYSKVESPSHLHQNRCLKWKEIRAHSALKSVSTLVRFGKNIKERKDNGTEKYWLYILKRHGQVLSDAPQESNWGQRNKQLFIDSAIKRDTNSCSQPLDYQIQAGSHTATIIKISSHTWHWPRPAMPRICLLSWIYSFNPSGGCRHTLFNVWIFNVHI